MSKENLYELSQIKQSYCEDIALIHATCFPHDPWSKETFETFFKEGWGNVIGCVAQLEGKVVGFILGRHVVDTAEILSFGVLPDFQRKGIGRKLLRHFLNEINTPLFLEVSVENEAAVQLYESFGFEVMTIRKDYYDRPSVKENRDAYLMRYERLLKEGI